MTDKIAFYQEVLASEPASKVFFKLAQLHAQHGRYEDAMSVLKKGLAYHPDHLEARLLLIESLEAAGRHDAARDEVGTISDLLARYPAFWRTWAETQDADTAFAMRFLAASFEGAPLSFAAILEHGIAALAAQPAPTRTEASVAPETTEPPELDVEPDPEPVAPPRPEPARPTEMEAAIEPAAHEDTPAEEFLAHEAHGAYEAEDVDYTEVEAVGPVPEPEPESEPEREAVEPETSEDRTYLTDFADAADVEAAMEAFLEEETAKEAAQEAESLADRAAREAAEARIEPTDAERFEADTSTLRTRTYAMILADQGEHRQALDILLELLEQSEPGALREDLARQIAALQKKLGMPLDDEVFEILGEAGPEAGERPESEPQAPEASDVEAAEPELSPEPEQEPEADDEAAVPAAEALEAEEIEAMAEEAPEAAAEPETQQEAQPEDAKEKKSAKKLLGVLGKLADRLESRAD